MARFLLLLCFAFLKFREICAYLYIKGRKLRNESNWRYKEKKKKKWEVRDKRGHSEGLESSKREVFPREIRGGLPKAVPMSLTITHLFSHVLRSHLLVLLCCYGTKVLLKEKESLITELLSRVGSNVCVVSLGTPASQTPLRIMPVFSGRAISLERPQKQSSCLVTTEGECQNTLWLPIFGGGVWTFCLALEIRILIPTTEKSWSKGIPFVSSF